MKHLAECILHKQKISILEVGIYNDKSKAIRLFNGGAPYATLTINLGIGPLKDRHYLIKTWGANEVWCKALLESGAFWDTGIRIKTNYVEASVWVLH